VLGDGLAPETKTRKMYEVERHERVTRHGRRLLSTLLPGAAQLLGGRTGWGVLLLLAWFAALVAWQPVILRPLDQLAGLDLRLDILGPEHIPAIYSPNPFSLVALPAMLGVWLLANAWLHKGSET